MFKIYFNEKEVQWEMWRRNLAFIENFYTSQLVLDDLDDSTYIISNWIFKHC